MAEACSKYPYAGGIYIWSGKVGLPKWNPIMAYFCGHCICLGALSNISTNSLGATQAFHSLIRVKDLNIQFVSIYILEKF